jgi:hypothetical protein
MFTPTLLIKSNDAEELIDIPTQVVMQPDQRLT